MRPTLRSQLFLGTVLAAMPTLSGELSLQEAFSRTAKLDGKSYALGRGLLERLGKPALPFLRQKAKSADWRERDLAGSLILRIEQPAKARLLDYALLWWKTELTFRDDGTVFAKLTGPVAALAKQRGEEAPAGRQVVFTHEAVPILLDALHFDGGSTSLEARAGARAIQILKHLGDPQAVPALLHLYAWRSWGPLPHIVDALVGIGPPALPLLRDTIRTCPVALPPKATAEESMRIGRAMRPSVAAARALGRLRDRAVAPLLADKLGQASRWDQVAAFSYALGQMQRPEGVPVVFTKLVELGKRFHERQPRLQSDHYRTLRKAMRSFGETARVFLLDQARGERPLGRQAIAGGLFFELQRPKEASALYRAFGQALVADADQARYWVGRKEKADPAAVGRRGFWYPHGPRRGTETVAVPAALLLERAYVFSEPDDLVRLTRLKGHGLAFDILADGVVWSRSDRAAPALAEMGDERALEVYGRLLHSDPPRLVGAQVEAMLLLGSPKAISLLDEVSRRAAKPERHLRSWWLLPRQQAAGKLATAVIDTLKGDPDALPRLLASKTPSVRVIAARCLARNGDLRALPVLAKAAAAAPGREHVSLRQAIVGLGKPALAPLAERQKASEDWREKLLCEAAALRIGSPKLAEAYDKAAAYRYPGYGMHVLTAGIFAGAGRQLAEAVGEGAVPLLEAAVAFEEYPPPRPTAVFALAQFKQERSIPVLVAAFPKTHRYRDGHPVALALQGFGPKGIEAAKKVPAPDPAKARYVSRARRHRGATETLAIARDVKTVENVIDGLRQPKPDKRPDLYRWADRTRVYLTLARKFHDPRLAEPIIQLLKEHGNEDVRNVALETVSVYQDERIVPLAIQALVASRKGYTQSVPLLALVRQRGADAVPLLIKLLREPKDEKARVAAAWALGQLGGSLDTHWHAAAEEKEDSAKVKAAAVTQAFGPLAEALSDGNAQVQTAAASALVTLVRRSPGKTQAKARETLVAWARTAQALPRDVAEFLARGRDPEAAHALLAAYRRDRTNIWVAKALGQLRCVEAVPELARAIDERLAQKRRVIVRTELDALGNLGAAGLEQVHGFLKRPVALGVRVEAARVLGSRVYRQAFDDALALFRQLWAKPIPASNSGQRWTFLGQIGVVADCLASLERERAYPILARALLDADHPDRRNAIARRLEMLERAHPELKKLSPLGK